MQINYSFLIYLLIITNLSSLSITNLSTLNNCLSTFANYLTRPIVVFFRLLLSISSDPFHILLNLLHISRKNNLLVFFYFLSQHNILNVLMSTQRQKCLSYWFSELFSLHFCFIKHSVFFPETIT